MNKTRFILIFCYLICFSSCGESSRQPVVDVTAVSAPPIDYTNSAEVNKPMPYFRLDSSRINSPEAIEKSDFENRPFEIHPPEFKMVDFRNYTHPGQLTLKEEILISKTNPVKVSGADGFTLPASIILISMQMRVKRQLFYSTKASAADHAAAARKLLIFTRRSRGMRV